MLFPHPFSSLDRAVLTLQSGFNIQNLPNKFWSCFRYCHCVGTALARVCNDLLLQAEKLLSLSWFISSLWYCWPWGPVTLPSAPPGFFRLHAGLFHILFNGVLSLQLHTAVVSSYLYLKLLHKWILMVQFAMTALQYSKIFTFVCCFFYI